MSGTAPGGKGPSGSRSGVERRPATQAEARALSHPVRLRVLRLCLDTALSNRELAERLGQDPATVLHHVRTLVRTGFLSATEERTGRRGSHERPYRATGKSWTLDIGSEASIVASVDAFRQELLAAGSDAVLNSTRLGVRLSPERLDEFLGRFNGLVHELAGADEEDGEPISIFVGIHRQPR